MFPEKCKREREYNKKHNNDHDEYKSSELPSDLIGLPPLGGKFFYADYFLGNEFGSHFVMMKFPNEELNLTLSIMDEHMTVITSHCTHSCTVPAKYHRGPKA